MYAKGQAQTMGANIEHIDVWAQIKPTSCTYM